MELESPHPVIANEFTDPPGGIVAPRVDGAERDQDVVVASRALDEFLDRVGPVPRRGVRVDGEHHRGSVVPTVVLGEIVDPGEVVRAEIEVAAGGFGQFVVVGAAPTRVDLDVGVNVDRLDGPDLDGALVTHYGPQLDSVKTATKRSSESRMSPRNEAATIIPIGPNRAGPPRWTSRVTTRQRPRPFRSGWAHP